MTDLLRPIEDAQRLFPWAEPNAFAMEDERVEAAVLRALSGPVPPELAFGVPLLRFADTDAVPLIQAVINDVRHAAHTCDLCGNSERSILDRLLVPAGASVVAVHVCWLCKASFDRPFMRGSLVWD
jgi:hypothetical protein